MTGLFLIFLVKICPKWIKHRNLPIATGAESPSTYNCHRRKLPQLFAKHAPASRMPAKWAS